MKSTMKVADEDDNIQYARTAVTITVERFVNRTMLRAAFSMVIGKQQQQDVQSSSDKYSPDVGRSCSRRRFSFDGDDGDHERHYRQGPETTDAAIPAACSPSSPRLPSRHHHYYSATTHTSPMKRFSSLVSFGLLVAVMFLAQAHIFSRIRFLQTDKVSTQASSSSSISGSSTELIRSSDDGKGLTRVSGEESDRLQRNLPHRVPLPIASGKDPSTTKEQEAPDNNRHESSTNTDAAETSDDFWSILSSAGRKAFRGGYAGALAAVVQVCSLMWLRTVMNYQYRYGGNMRTSLRKLWSEGGLARLYQGLPFALVQGPLSKFGDTAANGGALALLNALSPLTRGWPLVVKTACGSTAAGLWRIFLMPVDAAKTAMQVEGRDGLHLLWRSVADARSPGPLCKFVGRRIYISFLFLQCCCIEWLT